MHGGRRLRDRPGWQVWLAEVWLAEVCLAGWLIGARGAARVRGSWRA